jgi:serine/threonine protein kinase/tetratricopeptide (TPR) repeat protein
MTLAAGTRLGPYEILSSIGAGGMGEVYRARDTRLGRDVAVKVLPAEFAPDPERLRRFGQEAKATAALDHPNILAVFDIGTHDGTPYIVEQLLEGGSLRELLRGGPIPSAKAVKFGVQIAQGLAAAHEKGIVHRDLKPENLWVSKDGRVKILDFGLARLRPQKLPEQEPKTEAPTLDSPTWVGTVLGTPGYMSPEQVRGQAADERTDIFAFGCVLYEMLAGRKAFTGDTATDVAAAILKEDPPDLSKLAPKVPPVLAQLVGRCLEKHPEARFSSAHDLALALEAVSGFETAALVRGKSEDVQRPHWQLWALGAAAAVVLIAIVGGVVFERRPANPKTAPATTQKIVVLPFENLGAPEDAYFASGMTEEITSRLANVRGLAVISRTTAMHYEHSQESVKQIGAELGVAYVLEGSVRWEHGQGGASRVRITPQLIRAADDTHVWADSYDRDLADVFSIQSDVAESTVRAMGVALLPQVRATLQEASTNDIQAYDLYLRGLEFRSRGSDKSYEEPALNMFQTAVEHDSRFALAFVELAKSRLTMYWQYYDRSPQQLTLAKEAAERALELRPDLAEPHDALGYYYYMGMRDYPRALQEFGVALKIKPGDSSAICGTAYVLRRQGRWGDSVDWLDRALEVDPQNASIWADLAETCTLGRRYADSDLASTNAIALGPQWGGIYGSRALNQLRWKGDVREAQAILDQAARVSGLTDDSGELALATWRVAMARRDYQGWLRLTERAPRTIDYQGLYLPSALMRAQVLMLAGQGDAAHRSFDDARLELEQKVKRDPDDDRYRSSLAIAYAGLGRRDEAIREAKLGHALMPASRDALMARHRVETLALVYTMVGQNKEAIETLNDLLSRSGSSTPHTLRLDPRYDPLRADPRFQGLLKKYEVKE